MFEATTARSPPSCWEWPRCRWPLRGSVRETRCINWLTVKPFQLSGTGDLASFSRATAWLNSSPTQRCGPSRQSCLLVQFWTYTCINWLRTLPYARAWATRYKDQGLVVIGVHTPEFTFEEDVDNVRRAAQESRRQRTLLPSTTTGRFGVDLAITTGRRCTLSMLRERCATTNLAKATMKESEVRIRQLLAAAGGGGGDGPRVGFPSRPMVQRWARTGPA